MHKSSLKHRQLASQSPGNFADRVKTRVAAFGQGFIEAGAGDPGFFGHFGHAHGPGGRIQRVETLINSLAYNHPQSDQRRDRQAAGRLSPVSV